MSATTRQFDLYDFFSVLFPGVFLLAGLFPFLPQGNLSISLGLFLPLLVGGYVAGRFLHVVAERIEKELTSVVSHREKLQHELERLQNPNKSPELVEDRLLSQFCEECVGGFELEFEFPPDRSTIKNEIAQTVDDDKEVEELVNKAIRRRVESVYTLVRSQIHFNTKGRSRTFQAVFAFYRSTWVAFLLLGFMYISYAVGDAILGTLDQTIVLIPYPPLIEGINDLPLAIAVAELVAVLSIFDLAFRKAKDQFRDYYVQYLISDFLLIRQLNRQAENINISGDSEIIDSLNQALNGSDD